MVARRHQQANQQRRNDTENSPCIEALQKLKHRIASVARQRQADDIAGDDEEDVDPNEAAVV